MPSPPELIAARAQISRRGAMASLVRANPARLSQVFLNLALNAADAFDAPALRNRIVLDVSRSDDGAEVVITVSDNGRGIQPDLLGRIFEPLFTTKRADSGTGLGLWICRSIVADLGGTVSATSKVGVGTSMVVRRPAVASAPRL